MNDTVKTVTIKTENGPVRINHHDYDAKKHELHEGEILPPETTSGNATKDKIAVGTNANDGAANNNGSNEPIAYGVVPEGKGKNAKFFVVNSKTGERIEADNIDADGYATNEAAWAAVQAAATAGAS